MQHDRPKSQTPQNPEPYGQNTPLHYRAGPARNRKNSSKIYPAQTRGRVQRRQNKSGQGQQH